jgi:hypothetical protein
MSLVRSICGFASSEPQANQAKGAPELAKFHTMLCESARGLARHAELAPHDLGADELLSVASEDEELARRVLSVLVAGGGPAPLLTNEKPGNEQDPNHWRRLCRDLDIHLQLRNGIEQVRRRAAQASPGLAAMLTVASRQEEDHIQRLRDLIARADSLGLD